MIYWFTGQPGAGKTILGTKLHNFLKTEKRNWRQSVFHIDDSILRDLTANKSYTDEGRDRNVKNAQLITEYLHNNGCDVVVTMTSPNRKLREILKDKISPEDFQEIYVHTSENRDSDSYYIDTYESPEIFFIDVDTTKDSPNVSFSKLINNLNRLDKL